jgi:translation initiation factor 1
MALCVQYEDEAAPRPRARYNRGMSQNRVVYDSDVGRVDRCPSCGKKQDACRCASARPGPRQGTTARQGAPAGPKVPTDGVVRVSRDKKGRRGKTMTIVTGLPGGPAALAETATLLKRLCGSGGTVSGDAVEIQGDHRDRVAAKLTELGHKVKLAGG